MEQRAACQRGSLDGGEAASAPANGTLSGSGQLLSRHVQPAVRAQPQSVRAARAPPAASNLVRHLRHRSAAGLSAATWARPRLRIPSTSAVVDPEDQVREAAALAVAHRGEPAGAGMLELKVRVGDREPAVILACLSGLISLAPTWGVARAIELLRDESRELHEVAAVALESRGRTTRWTHCSRRSPARSSRAAVRR